MQQRGQGKETRYREGEGGGFQKTEQVKKNKKV